LLGGSVGLFHKAVCSYPHFGGCAVKIGFSLPNIGPIGTAEAITKVAQRAEALGYSSLWTIERHDGRTPS